MASGEKLFNQDGKQIYPISHASVIISEALKANGNVETCLKDIYAKLTDISEEAGAAKNINVKIGYLLLSSKEESYAKEQTGWGAFAFPDANQPYLWKKTSFSYDELELTTVYEIALMYPENTSETVYRAYADITVEKPEIFYGTDDDGNIDYNQPLLTEWSYNPVSISAEKPYVYMATRRKIDGEWQPFSAPALYGRWTFDSTITIKYAITDSLETPNFDAYNSNPGADWFDTNTQEFTGYLWMITATKIGGNYYSSETGVIWSNPNLISIVK